MPLIKRALQPAAEGVEQQGAPFPGATQEAVVTSKKLGVKKAADEQAAGVAQAAKEIAAVVDAKHPRSYYQKTKFGETMTQFDIDLDERICRSGLYQAALQSSGVYSFSKAKNLKDYLAAVAEASDAAYEYVQRKR